MLNIPDDCVNHPNAPWNKEEWHCPLCGGNENDVDCTILSCKEYEIPDFDCECEGEE